MDPDYTYLSKHMQIGDESYEGLWLEITERRRPEFDEACMTYAETGDEEDLLALHEHLQVLKIGRNPPQQYILFTLCTFIILLM